MRLLKCTCVAAEWLVIACLIMNSAACGGGGTATGGSGGGGGGTFLNTQLVGEAKGTTGVDGVSNISTLENPVQVHATVNGPSGQPLAGSDVTALSLANGSALVFAAPTDNTMLPGVGYSERSRLDPLTVLVLLKLLDTGIAVYDLVSHNGSRVGENVIALENGEIIHPEIEVGNLRGIIDIVTIATSFAFIKAPVAGATNRDVVLSFATKKVAKETLKASLGQQGVDLDRRYVARVWRIHLKKGDLLPATLIEVEPVPDNFNADLDYFPITNRLKVTMDQVQWSRGSQAWEQTGGGIEILGIPDKRQLRWMATGIGRHPVRVDYSYEFDSSARIAFFRIDGQAYNGDTPLDFSALISPSQPLVTRSDSPRGVPEPFAYQVVGQGIGSDLNGAMQIEQIEIQGTGKSTRMNLSDVVTPQGTFTHCLVVQRDTKEVHKKGSGVSWSPMRTIDLTYYAAHIGMVYREVWSANNADSSVFEMAPAQFIAACKSGDVASSYGNANRCKRLEIVK